MSVVLITGGIGSGKSEVCRILKDDYGLPCYNADSRVKELYISNLSLLTDIEDSLGLSLRDAEGNFLPWVLADRIFTSDDALRKVESLVFPVLADDFKKWQSEQDSDILILESATALEKESLAWMYDKVVVVDAPFDLRLSRACSRDCSKKEKVLQRMHAQVLMNKISEGYDDYRVDFLLDNISDLEDLKSKVAELVDIILYNKKVK